VLEPVEVAIGYRMRSGWMVHFNLYVEEDYSLMFITSTAFIRGDFKAETAKHQ
jgi:hypothetical protein